MHKKSWTRRGRDDLTCEQVISFLFEYLDDGLEPERRRDFERHLAICPSCLAYLKTYRETARLGRLALSRDAVRPARFAPELARAIATQRGRFTSVDCRRRRFGGARP